MTTIQDLSAAVRAIATDVGPSVVGVAGRRSVGSGLVIGAGRILTNAHNVRRPDEALAVSFAGGRSASGRVLALDADGDLAVIEADTADVAPTAWADDPSVVPEIVVGTAVFALADPGGRGLRVTFGFVSGVDRSFRGPRGRLISGGIEHTAPLLPGSSGGPVVDDRGRLVGVNTHRLGDGFYLAIPADASLRARVEALSSGRSTSRRRLGVAIAPADVTKRLRRAVGLEEVDGLLVRGVEEDSPASKAGLREGDVLVRATGRDLSTADDLFAALDAYDPSTGLKIDVVRGTEELTIEVRLDG